MKFFDIQHRWQRQINAHPKTAWTQFFLTVLAFIWGFVFLNPKVDVFAVSPRLYTPLRQIADSQFAWGTVFLGIAVLQLYAFFAENVRVKKGGLLVASGVCFSMAVLFIMGDPNALLGCLVYLLHTLSAARAYWILARGE